MASSAPSDNPDHQPRPSLPQEVTYGEKIQQWQTILGDMISGDKVQGDKIVQYIFQSLPDSAQGSGELPLIEKEPYRPNRPFNPSEWSSFAGREQEIRTILGYLVSNQSQSVVISGAADVGKTSLIAAGIIPALIVNNGFHAMLQDYGRPTHQLRRELLARAAGQDLFPDNSSSPAEIALQIVNSTERRLILILDQFERAFLRDISPTMRQELRQEINSFISLLPREQFKVLIAIRDDMQLELYDRWQDLLPDIGESSLQLLGLKPKEAQRAIELPAELSRRDEKRDIFYFDRESKIIKRLILPDLADLSENDPERILPADLQIVCTELYNKAMEKEQEPHIINADIYFEAGKNRGAAFIIIEHFRTLIGKVPHPIRELAHKITQAKLLALDHFWSTPQSLTIAGVNTADIAITMAEMVRAGILISHEIDHQTSFAFASDSIAKAAAHVAGPDFENKLEARKQVQAAFGAWLRFDTLAGRGQLRLIQAYGHVHDPLKLLLLLRSAVVQSLPVFYWLEGLRTPQARQLLRSIEEPDPSSAQDENNILDLRRVKSLLGILDENQPSPPAGFSDGPITRSAVYHSRQAVRETAILALMIAYEKDKENSAAKTGDAYSVVLALWDRDQPLIDRSRMAELIGLMSAADENLARRNKKRRGVDRFAIWRWRFHRLYNRDKPYLWSLTAGGAVGAGLGLGLLRFLLALFMPYRSGDALIFYFPLAFFLGGALTLGVLLTDTVRLRRRDVAEQSSQKRPLLPTLAMGAAAFTIMHILAGILLGVGLIRAPLAHLLSLLAGASLAYVIYDQPLAGWRSRKGQWLWRLAVAGAVAAIIQIFFILYNPSAFSILYFWSGSFYSQQLAENLRVPFSVITGIENWSHYLALIDAALTGIMIGLGTAAGLLIAAKWFNNWQALKVRAGE